MYFDIPGFDNYEINSVGEVRHKVLQKPLKTRRHPDGYIQFSVYQKPKGSQTQSLHRLMALAFVPNPQNKPQVNHKNGVKVDNRPCNLEWVTLSENRQHAYDTGLQTPHSVWRKLSPETVKEIRSLGQSTSQAALAKKYGVSQTFIGQILNNKRRTNGVSV